MNSILNALAQAAPAGGSQSFLTSQLPLLLIFFAIFYFLVLRPQSKKAKEHQAMLSELKKGDEVVTTSGIIGKISGLSDAELTLQVQEGVRLRVTRASVQGRYGATAAKAEKAAEKTDTKAS
ncbi:MAG: preprotein translocase subunit YajC [Myxococcales bacterium]|nr:preprotein translocase subunit YajC [Myxococcales bacterium]